MERKIENTVELDNRSGMKKSGREGGTEKGVVQLSPQFPHSDSKSPTKHYQHSSKIFSGSCSVDRKRKSGKEAESLY